MIQLPTMFIAEPSAVVVPICCANREETSAVVAYDGAAFFEGPFIRVRSVIYGLITRPKVIALEYDIVKFLWKRLGSENIPMYHGMK